MPPPSLNLGRANSYQPNLPGYPFPFPSLLSPTTSFAKGKKIQSSSVLLCSHVLQRGPPIKAFPFFLFFPFLLFSFCPPPPPPRLVLPSHVLCSPLPQQQLSYLSSLDIISSSVFVRLLLLDLFPYPAVIFSIHLSLDFTLLSHTIPPLPS